MARAAPPGPSGRKRGDAKAAYAKAGGKTGRRRPAEPSTLPVGISGLNAIFFCLITADLGTLGGLAAWIGDPGAGGLLPVVGIALGIIYCCFPLQFLDGRATLALSGYRILLRALLVLHVPLAILLLLALHAGADSAGDLFLTAPVSILATPGLYVIWRALVSLRWLDPAAPIETWEAMPGIDGTAMSTDGPPKQATPMAVALTLPFVAAWRARQTAMAACAGLLWLGALALAPVAPWQALLAFCLAAGIGQRAAAGATGATDGPPEPATDRMATLRAIFPPARLVPAPAFAAAGLLALPCLFIIDFTALGAFLALPGVDSVASLRAALGANELVLLLLLALAFIPAMFFMPLGTPAGKLTFRLAALGLGLGEIGLAGLYAAIGFHIAVGGIGIVVPQAAATMLRPIMVLLLGGLMLALVALRAVPGFGGVANLLAD